MLSRMARLRTPSPTIWDRQVMITRQLFTWGTGNIVAGAVLQQGGNRFLRGVGMQALAWGMVNCSIALVGGTITALRRRSNPHPTLPYTQQKEARNLRRLLWINAVLDVGYMLGGMGLALSRGKHNDLWRGGGWGIVLQGAFLLLFDTFHALLLSTESRS